MRGVASLRSLVGWYLRGAFTVYGAAMVGVILLSLTGGLGGDLDGAAMVLWFTLDAALYPVLVLYIGLHVVREDRVTVFEVTLSGSLARLYIARIVAFLIILGPVHALLALLLAAGGYMQASIGFAAKIAPLTGILLSSMLLRGARSAVFMLVTAYILLPFSTPVIVSQAIQEGGQLDPVLTILVHFFTPVLAALYRIQYPWLFALDYAGSILAIIVAGIVIAIGSLLALLRQEYNV